VVDEHKVIMIALVIASVAMLGTVVELTEFIGFTFLGAGEGIMFTGPGDSDKSPYDHYWQYVDTMEDIIVNTLGSIVGVCLFYYTRYKKKPWL
jgi:uncharacterized membrane protein YjdF